MRISGPTLGAELRSIFFRLDPGAEGDEHADSLKMKWVCCRVVAHSTDGVFRGFLSHRGE